MENPFNENHKLWQIVCVADVTVNQGRPLCKKEPGHLQKEVKESKVKD
jgi:hypothetical protein